MGSATVSVINRILQELSEKSKCLMAECLNKCDDRLQWMKDWSREVKSFLKQSESASNKNHELLPVSSAKQISVENSEQLQCTYPKLEQNENFQSVMSVQICMNSKQQESFQQNEYSGEKYEVNENTFANFRFQLETRSANSARCLSVDLKQTENSRKRKVIGKSPRESNEYLLEKEVLSDNIKMPSQMKHCFPFLYSSEGFPKEPLANSQNLISAKGKELCVGNTGGNVELKMLNAGQSNIKGNSATSVVVPECKETGPEITYTTPTHLPISIVSGKVDDFHDPASEEVRVNKTFIKKKKWTKVRSRLQNLNSETTYDLECTYLRLRVHNKFLKTLPCSKPIVETPKPAFLKKSVTMESKPQTTRKNELKRQGNFRNCIRTQKNIKPRRLVGTASIQHGPMTRKRLAQMEKKELQENSHKRSLQKKMMEKKKQREERMRKCKENREKLKQERLQKAVVKSKLRTKSMSQLNIFKSKAAKRKLQPKPEFTKDAIPLLPAKVPGSKKMNITFVVRGSQTNNRKKSSSVSKAETNSNGDMSKQSDKDSASNSKKSTCENYDISSLKESDDSEISLTTKSIPSWAQALRLKAAIIHQIYNDPKGGKLFGKMPECVELGAIFGAEYLDHEKRKSSAIWDKTPCSS